MTGVKTLEITNFRGSMVPNITGDINSGNSYWLNQNGPDPFSKPGNLTWNENPELIDPMGSVITDLVMAGKVKIESGVTYVYCVGHTGRVYKIQVNDPATYNPDYDNPVLLTTLTINTPTFTRGGFIDFFDSVGRIYISHDKGVTRIDFDGSNETFVGDIAQWIQNVPKPLQQFLGKLYIGNGNNFAEIDSTSTVTTYAKLNPSFPSGTQVRDIKLTVDGNYLQSVVTRAALSDVTSTTPDTSLIVPTDSYLFSWNGTDVGYTSSQSYPAVILTSANFSADSSIIFGYDSFTASAYTPVRKVITALPDVITTSPLPNAIFSIGNLTYWACTLFFKSKLSMLVQAYGNLSDSTGTDEGFWCPIAPFATEPETDVLTMPFFLPVSNLAGSASSSGYADGIVGNPKAYFSTLETSDTTTKYRFYRWKILPTGVDNVYPTGLYQTVNQLFSKKIKPTQVRVYGGPWIADNEFAIELVSIDGDTTIPNTSFTFTAGTNLTIGQDFAWYDVVCEPVASMGLRVICTGTNNFIISKIEIDYTEAGI